MPKIQLTSELLTQLKFINTNGLQPGDYEFPDFLIIGPQRTGTTWLHRHLLLHPEVFIPAEKEIYFFNYLKIKDSEGTNYTSDRLEWYSSRFSPSLRDFLKRNIILFRSYRSIRKCDLGLVKFFSPTIKGEATASYAAMSRELINEVFVLHPGIKIILMLRNPIDRAWSHAKKDLLKGTNRKFDEVPFEEFMRFYSSNHMINCGRYTEIIDRWQEFVDRDNFFIGQFSDIHNDPIELLASICDFLGIKMSKLEYEHRRTAQKIVNPTEKISLPDNHKEYLRNLFDEDMLQMNSSFGLDWR